MVARLSKWGNSLAVRLPKAFTDQMGVREGSWVQLKIDVDRVVIEPTKPRYRIKKINFERTKLNA